MTLELNKAIKKSVVSIGKDSRTKTPVDTGRLRASTLEKFSNLKGEVGTHTSYDFFVHEGTRFMRPRPYLRTSVEGNRGNVDRFFTEAVNNVLSDIGKKT